MSKVVLVQMDQQQFKGRWQTVPCFLLTDWPGLASFSLRCCCSATVSINMTMILTARIYTDLHRSTSYIFTRYTGVHHE